ncbi:MAG: potassium channel family protein [Novosphingobium sp.]
MTLRARAYYQLYPDRGGANRSTLLNRLLVFAIIAAITVSVLATEPELTARAPLAFEILEDLFGVIFLAEYSARLWTAAERPGEGTAMQKRLRYALTPLAIIDLIVVVVTLTPLFIADATVLRLLRLLRLIMLAKFGRFSRAFREIGEAMHERRYELLVTAALAGFLLLFGATALYLVEGDIQPDKFGSIPRALWWSIITLTTVGYGDVSPITPLDKFLAAIVALAGIGMVAMPTGIMAAAFTDAMQEWRKEHPEDDHGRNDA